VPVRVALINKERLPAGGDFSGLRPVYPAVASLFRPGECNVAGEKVNIVNRKARFNYEVVSSREAGIALAGAEVKSIRAGRVSLQEAYCKFEDAELFLIDCHIAPYAQAGTHARLSPTRPRKLLLERSELTRLKSAVSERGLTIVPLKMYNRGPYIKMEIALVRGKKRVDKRRTIKERDLAREQRRLGGRLRL